MNVAFYVSGKRGRRGWAPTRLKCFNKDSLCDVVWQGKWRGDRASDGCKVAEEADEVSCFHPKVCLCSHAAGKLSQTLL